MEIIEQTLVPKNPKKKSEDGIVVTNDFIAVIDGSTSKSDYHHSLFSSNGRYAMKLVSSYIQHMPKNTTCDTFLRGVTAYVRKHYKKSMMQRLTEHPEDRLTASVIVFSRVCREIWMVGDCQCLVNGVPYTNEKPTEKANALRRSALLHQALEEGHTTIDRLRHDDIGRAAILSDIIQSTRRQNIDFAVIDGYPIAMDYVRVLFVPVAEEIVLASDGYPKLFNDLASTEAYLEQVIREDPLFISLHPATKGVMDGNESNDDRSYIRFMV